MGVLDKLREIKAELEEFARNHGQQAENKKVSDLAMFAVRSIDQVLDHPEMEDAIKTHDAASEPQHPELVPEQHPEPWSVPVEEGAGTIGVEQEKHDGEV